jgi:hypothetical protein
MDEFHCWLCREIVMPSMALCPHCGARVRERQPNPKTIMLTFGLLAALLLVLMKAYQLQASVP